MRQSIWCSTKTAHVTFSVVTVWFGVDHDGDDNDDDSGGDGVICISVDGGCSGGADDDNDDYNNINNTGGDCCDDGVDVTLLLMFPSYNIDIHHPTIDMFASLYM